MSTNTAPAGRIGTPAGPPAPAPDARHCAECGCELAAAAGEYWCIECAIEIDDTAVETK